MSDLEKLFSLKGKVALVTGSYRGLGLAIARGLANAGARVVINGRSREGVEAAVDEMKEDGLEALPAVFDVQDEASVKDGIRKITERWGRVDILVNNAGIQRRSPLEELSVDDFKLVLDVNLTSAFLVAREVVPGMIEAGSGKIINICSLMSDLARPTTGPYAAAKGGLRMLTRAMAGEWAKHNIQVNGIGPGYFESEMTEKLRNDPDFNNWICGRTPAARWGKPEELQGLAVFLAAQGSSFVNGQVVYVDGGLTAVI